MFVTYSQRKKNNKETGNFFWMNVIVKKGNCILCPLCHPDFALCKKNFYIDKLFKTL